MSLLVSSFAPATFLFINIQLFVQFFRATGDLKLAMWLVLAVVIVTSKVEGKTHSSHLDELDQLDDLDYSHNIFIPLNAYENYELFMEFARGSELGKKPTLVRTLI